MTKRNSVSNISPSYDTNRQVLGEIYPLDAPFNVIIDSSEACNFRCNYCFRYDRDKRNWSYAASCGIMNFELFKKVYDQIGQFPTDVKQISLSNHGEPLCNRDVPRMARYMRDNGYNGRISIHTNGSLLDKDYAVELGKAGLSRIVISIQGMNSEKYKTVCGANVNFGVLCRNIETLYDASRDSEYPIQIDVKIADVALKEGEEEEFYRVFSPMADRVFVENIVPIWKNSSVGSDKGINKFGEEFKEQKCCPLIFHTIVVTPDGDVYPCTQLLNDYCLGNISEITLKECWESKERVQMLENILKLDRPKMCDGCGILQNSIYVKEDMIDDYRCEILERLYKGD